jgi:hypothetical protein
MPPQGGWQSPQQPPQSGWQPPQQPPPGWQQGPFAQQPGPPPPKGNSVKWLLVAIAVLLVIGVTIGATLLFTRGGGGGGPTPTTSAAPSDIASANDTGPVAIITDEPTCTAVNGINSSIADVEANGWGDQRKTLGPASEWTPPQREQVQAVATAIHNAADQMVSLAKQTPHRVVREIYEQYIAYGRAYVDSIPTYVPADNLLADVNVSLGNTLLGICNSIQYGSANRSVAIAPVSPPTNVAGVGDPANPQRFVSSSNSACTAWVERGVSLTASTSDWEKLNPNTPAAQWTQDERATQHAALSTFTTLANDIESAGRQSGNAVLEDFAILAAVYFRGYVASGDNYVSADSWLGYTALRAFNAVSGACQAALG